MINSENRDETQRRRKRITVSEEFMGMLFSHPNNYFTTPELPDDAQFVDFFYEPSFCRLNFVYKSEEWDILEEGGQIPELDLSVYEINCNRCHNEMFYDEEKDEQYCPRCSRRFKNDHL